MKKYIIALISLFFLTACVFRNIPEYEFTAKNYVNDKFFITAQLVNTPLILHIKLRYYLKR